MRLQSLKYNELLLHGVNEKFARVLSDPVSYHKDLSCLVGTTNWDYYIPDGATDIVPLWDANADSIVRWSLHGEVEYVKLFHDDPEWLQVSKSEQGAMAKLWQQWIEFYADELDSYDREPARFAEAIGFRYHEKALCLQEADYDAFERWRVDLPD